MTVADLVTVWVIGDLFERDLHLVASATRPRVTTTAYPGERFDGRVNYISDVIDPAYAHGEGPRERRQPAQAG